MSGAAFLGADDIVHIPAGVPQRFPVTDGHLTCVLLKIPAGSQLLGRARPRSS
jgi:hypothetical protein